MDDKRSDDKRTGELLGMPFDWRTPTLERIRERCWNADDHRILTPKVFGWGFTINLHEVARRIGLVR